jgi:hypothetical protein
VDHDARSQAAIDNLSIKKRDRVKNFGPSLRPKSRLQLDWNRVLPTPQEGCLDKSSDRLGLETEQALGEVKFGDCR